MDVVYHQRLFDNSGILVSDNNPTLYYNEIMKIFNKEIECNEIEKALEKKYKINIQFQKNGKSYNLILFILPYKSNLLNLFSSPNILFARYKSNSVSKSIERDCFIT